MGYLGFVFFLILSISFAVAQESSSNLENGPSVEVSFFPVVETVEDLIEESEGFDDSFDVSPGLTPDSPFYFLDGFIDSREEKVAEMRKTAERCGSGDESSCESLKIAFEKYKEYAKNVEKEVSPEEREIAKKTSRAIRGVLVREIAKNAPPTFKDDLIREVVNDEKDISISADVASKVSDLCLQLHDLGEWEKFDKACRTDNNSPRWQRALFQDLSNKQKVEIGEFGKVMSSCFENSDSNCDCSSISHEGLASICIVSKPLAMECESGDIGSCEKLDSLELPTDLPDYLNEVLNHAEINVNEANYQNHIPKVCLDAGIVGDSQEERDKCSVIRVLSNSPLECRDELSRREINSDVEARKICEEVLFKLHAPQECIDREISNPDDCADLLKESFNSEKEIQDDSVSSFRVSDCKVIENLQGKLECYEGVSAEFNSQFEGQTDESKKFPEPCRKAGALDQDSCGALIREHIEKKQLELKNKEIRCSMKCEEKGQTSDFSGGVCSCLGSSKDEIEKQRLEVEQRNREKLEESQRDSDKIDEGLVQETQEISQESGKSFITGNAFLSYYFR